ncbi:MAG: hypothetical protein U9P44_02650 [archaeon]|nr:hypothetical protein [archaeon]
MKTAVLQLVIALFVLFFFISPVYGSQIKNHEIVVVIDDFGIALTSVNLSYEDLTTDEIYYFVFAQIDSLAANDNYGILLCNTESYSYGTQIRCKPNTEDNLNYSVHLDFNMLSLQSAADEEFFFGYDYSIRVPIERFVLKFVLPTGTALIEDKNGISPYFPEYGVIGSTGDGRHITVTWTEENPSLGSDHSYRVFYEKVTQIHYEGITYPVILLLLVLVLVMSFLSLKYMKTRKVNTVLSVLHKGERMVVELLIGNDNRCDQRVLVKETGFSKAKLSRILLDLEDRGLITKTRRGRTNIVKLLDKKMKS